MLRSINNSSNSNSQTYSNLKPSWVCPAAATTTVCRPRRRPTIPTVLAILCPWPDCNFPPVWRRSTAWPVWLVVECSNRNSSSSSNSQQCNYLRFPVKANSSTKWVGNSLRTSTPVTCPFSCRRVEPRSGTRSRTVWPVSLIRWSTRWLHLRRTMPRRWG